MKKQLKKCKINLYNPKNLTIYTKNANVIYTNNPLTFSISCSRINMWQNSTDLSTAGDINNIPDYSWYKDDGLLQIEGTITSDLTNDALEINEEYFSTIYFNIEE